MNQVKSWKIAAFLFSFVLTFTFIPTEAKAISCDEAIFYYYEGLLDLMQKNKDARTEIDGWVKKAKKSAKKYKTQGSQLKRFNSDGIWDDDEKNKVLKMEKKHQKLKKYYQRIQSKAVEIINTTQTVDTLGKAVDDNCP